MHLSLGPSFLSSRETLLSSIVRNTKDLVLAGLFSAQVALAQNPGHLSQSTDLSSMQYANMQSTLDGTLIEPGHESHDLGVSDSLEGHVVFSTEALSGAVLPNGEFASRDGVSSFEMDAFLQKKHVSSHIGVHHISPLTHDDDLEQELATSFIFKYDDEPFHIAAGVRHYDHSAFHTHQDVHIHNDGHGHISQEIQTIQELVHENYMAALLQVGYDFGDHVTVFAGTEWDLGIKQDMGQDQTHLTYAGFDIHGHLSDWHLALRMMLAHSHGNKNEPNATFFRPSFHAETPLLPKVFHDRVYFILFGEGIVPLDNNREGGAVGGVGLRVRF